MKTSFQKKREKIKSSLLKSFLIEFNKAELGEAPSKSS